MGGETKGSRLISVDKVLKHANIQAVVWLLQGAFIQTFSENQDKMAELNYLKSLVPPERNHLQSYGKEQHGY